MFMIAFWQMCPACNRHPVETWVMVSAALKDEVVERLMARDEVVALVVCPL